MSKGAVAVVLAIATGGAFPEARASASSGGGSPNVAPSSFAIVENAGQFDAAVRFQARSSGQTLWVTDSGLWITALSSGPVWDRTAAPDRPGQPGPTTNRHWVNLRISFPGSRANASVVPSDPLPTRMNYFLGSDRRRWRSGVRTYGSVTWRGLYPGVSLTLTQEDGEPALAVRADPGAGPPELKLRLAGANVLMASLDGRLAADTAVGAVPLPSVLLGGRRLTGTVAGTLVSFGAGRSGSQSSIDARSSPRGTAVGEGLLYSTFLGGGDVDFARDLAVGPDGSKYVTGQTASADFPTTPGAFDPTFNGDLCTCSDAYVSKLDPTGSTLLYSTFVGGGDGDYGLSLALGSDGSTYMGGSTESADYPTTPGAFDTSYAGGDGVITKLDPQGSALVYSTFLGGSQSNDAVNALVLVGGGRIYAAGETLSPDYPTTPGAYDRTLNNGLAGAKDAFATVLDPTGSTLLYSTFLGGSLNDFGYAIAVGAGGAAYVTGFAQSSDFPTTPGAFDPTFNGGNNDLFLAEVTPDGSALAYSTYLGGSDNEDGRAIAVDPAGRVTVAGLSGSPDYPTTPGAYDPTINSHILQDVVLTRLNPAGSALVYSTFLGGENIDLPGDVMLDPDGSATVVGTTYSPNFPSTAEAFDGTFGGYDDAFVSRFDPTGGALVYSTFLGGDTIVQDQGLGIAPAGPGLVTISGETGSPDFPVTPGAYDTTHNGGFDGFLASLRTVPTMHVDRIVPRYRPQGTGYQVGAAIRILRGDGSPVSGASVTVRLDYPNGDEVVLTRLTGTMGVAVVARPASDTGLYTFTVLNVTHPSAAYDRAQNVETFDSVIIP